MKLIILILFLIIVGCSREVLRVNKNEEIIINDVGSYFNKIYKYSINNPKDFIVVDSENIDSVANDEKTRREIREMFSGMVKAGWKENNKGEIIILKYDDIDEISFILSGYPTSDDRFTAEKTRENAKKYKIETNESEILIGKDKITGVRFVTDSKSGVAYNTVFGHGDNYFSFSFIAPSDENRKQNIGYYESILASIDFK